MAYFNNNNSIKGGKDKMGENEKPLTGVRVLDIACFIAAPYAATLMGEFGADVIKIEHPNGGDPLPVSYTHLTLPTKA